MALSKWLLKGWIFCAQRAKNETPPETLKLKVREVSQIGFSNISWQPTSVPSFSQIGWPQVLAPGTLSQTMTLKVVCFRFRLCPQSKLTKLDIRRARYPFHPVHETCIIVATKDFCVRSEKEEVFPCSKTATGIKTWRNFFRGGSRIFEEGVADATERYRKLRW